MFKGYNLDLSKSEKQSFLGVSDEEIANYESSIGELKSSLKAKMNENVFLPRDADGKIDGSKIINDWFPGYKADVFISHSHNDSRTAKRLAIWLNRNFNLTTFIDSIIWGSSNSLLQEIDNEYSVLRKKDDHITYDYNIRNFTTSHVHMMLSAALNDIIDQTECLIFLNTPESLSVNETTNKKTNSPWIYNELKTASIVRKVHPRKTLIRGVIEKRFQMYAEKKESLEILYPVDKQLAELGNLDSEKLQRWLESYNSRPLKDIHGLDILYFGKSLFNMEDILQNGY